MEYVPLAACIPGENHSIGLSGLKRSQEIPPETKPANQYESLNQKSFS